VVAKTAGTINAIPLPPVAAKKAYLAAYYKDNRVGLITLRRWRACLLASDLESVRPDHAVGAGCELMSAGMEMTTNQRVSGQEVMDLLGRVGPLHVALSSSCRRM